MPKTFFVHNMRMWDYGYNVRIVGGHIWTCQENTLCAFCYCSKWNVFL